jgi:hypothetical protein
LDNVAFTEIPERELRGAAVRPPITP